MDKVKLMMLALMNDKMCHHKDAIMHSVFLMNVNSLDEVEFDKLWKNTNGHGGKDIGW